MINLLAIDYGLKFTGLALARSPLAEPLYTIKTDDLEKTLDQLIHEHQIQGLVVGISEGQMAKITQQKANQLAAKYSLKLFFQDETLTSYETRKQVAQAKFKKKKREAKIDHLVAAVLLQEFLDSPHGSID
jgi:putative holliday junction resolvase